MGHPVKKKKKKERWFATPRNVEAEMQAAINAQRKAMPQLLDMKNQWDASFALADAETLRKAGPAMHDAMLAASPEMRSASKALLSGLDNVGPSAIEKKLTADATDELNLGGQLSGDELQALSQGTRSTFADRGLLNSPGASAAELMTRAGAMEQRKAQRRAFAGTVDSMANQRKAMDNQFTLNAANASRAFDPSANILGRSAAADGFNVAASWSNAVGAANQQSELQSLLAKNENKLKRDRLAWDQEAFWVNREDSLNNAAMNNSAQAAAAKDSNNSSYAAAGAVALIALAALI